jgi:hypothetical protein
MGQNDTKLMEAAIALEEELNFFESRTEATHNSTGIDEENCRIRGPSWCSTLCPESSDGRSQ